MSRGFWFLAGAGAGVYAVTKARRATAILTPEGWSDRLSSLSLGAQLFVEEYRSARDDKDAELRQSLGLSPDTTPILESPHGGSMNPATPKELN